MTRIDGDTEHRCGGARYDVLHRHPTAWDAAHLVLVGDLGAVAL